MKKITLLVFLLGLYAIPFAQTAAELKKVYSDLTVFADPMATSLRKGVKKADIKKVENIQIRAVAEEMFANNYEKQYRYASYQPKLSPKELGVQLSIGDGYSKFENVTGVYLPVGQHIILADGIKKGQTAGLIIPNWERRPPNPDKPTEDKKGWGIERRNFTLQNGVNIIEVKDWGGLVYVDYFSKNPGAATPINIHFLGAAVNGYFDIAKDGDEEWDRLANEAVYPVMDALGRYIQVAYPVEAIKKYAQGRGVELLSNYDSLIYRQHRIMGLIKYDRVPQNRILSRVNYNYYMFRDGDGVAYMEGKSGYAMGMVVHPDKVIKGDPCWGFSHEVGHVHQMRPYLNWGGLGEVSNNIYSLYGTTSFGNKSRLSEQKNYQKARESLYGKGISYLQEKDVFNRLVPFWQLHLYFTGAGNQADFYPDLFESFRIQAAAQYGKGKRGDNGNYMDRGRNPAVHQLNFVKKACEVGKTDLTEFFDNYGFFYVGEFEFDDYGKYKYEMTQEMVDQCKREIAAMNLPKPKVDISLLED